MTPCQHCGKRPATASLSMCPVWAGSNKIQHVYLCEECRAHFVRVQAERYMQAAKKSL
ncbi:hypothetical protein [Desulfovibrio sp. An276]|uniref:hypothetical protein n=1 Tax=Desulfovibrio sp. An276 TaxID=1965618 RepID=UPI0013A6184B|nr:hypothetical protein [Desulfovibrio sp. An276]